MKVIFNRTTTFIVFAVMVLTSLGLFSCALWLPTPSDAQILEAVRLSNQGASQPLSLVYDDMEVPHRFPGRASAVLWVLDRSIQRNFSVSYDKKEKAFYVESFMTLIRGEDGVYRVDK